jgi:hypothetical protein
MSQMCQELTFKRTQIAPAGIHEQPLITVGLLAIRVARRGVMV